MYDGDQKKIQKGERRWSLSKKGGGKKEERSGDRFSRTLSDVGIDTDEEKEFLLDTAKGGRGDDARLCDLVLALFDVVVQTDLGDASSSDGVWVFALKIILDATDELDDLFLDAWLKAEFVAETTSEDGGIDDVLGLEGEEVLFADDLADVLFFEMEFVGEFLGRKVERSVLASETDDRSTSDRKLCDGLLFFGLGAVVLFVELLCDLDDVLGKMKGVSVAADVLVSFHELGFWLAEGHGGALVHDTPVDVDLLFAGECHHAIVSIELCGTVWVVWCVCELSLFLAKVDDRVDAEATTRARCEA